MDDTPSACDVRKRYRVTRLITFRRLVGLAFAIIMLLVGAAATVLCTVVWREIQSLSNIQNCGVHASCTDDGTVVLTFTNQQGDPELARIAPYLKSLRQKVALQMDKCQVTDAGLASLKGLTNIRVLRLEHDKITDASLDTLSTLTGLRGLALTGTQVSDAGIKKLKLALPDAVEKLTAVQDDALEEIQNARRDLTWSARDGALIDARLDNATDADLHRLKKPLEVFKESLQELRLSGKGVTDSGLNSLKGLSNLRRLTLKGTSVTEDGVRQLRKALPQLEVSQ